MFVRVLNVEDNPPYLTVSNFRIMENQLPGETVTYLSNLIFDLDLEPSTYGTSLLSPPHSDARFEYKLNSIDISPFEIHPLTGRLRTTVSLDREAVSVHRLPILVRHFSPGTAAYVNIDTAPGSLVNGSSPEPMRSTFYTLHVTIEVLDQNDNAPATQTLTVIVVRPENSDVPSRAARGVNGSRNGADILLCPVRPLDADSTGSYSCLVRGENARSLSFASSTTSYAIGAQCSLYVRPGAVAASGNATLLVSANDGGRYDSGAPYAADYEVKVVVFTYSPLQLGQALSLRVQRTDVSAYFDDLVDFVYAESAIRLRFTEVTADHAHPVLFTFYGEADGALVEHSKLYRRLDDLLPALQVRLSARVSLEDSRSCGGCYNGGVCELRNGAVVGTTSRWVSLNSTATLVTRNASASRYACVCPAPYEGLKCESKMDTSRCVGCERGVCCHGDGGVAEKWACLCNGGWTGRRCNMDIDECKRADICNKRGTCENLVGSYSCTCNNGKL